MPNFDNVISLIQNSQQTLLVLCGLPYAGKSYVAKHLLGKSNLEFVSIDDIFRERGFDWNTNKLPSAEEWQQIFDESYQKTKVALGQGKNVLYDSTNHTVASRHKLQEIASSVGGQSKVLYVKSAVGTIWKRWEENQKNPTRTIVGRELVQSTIDYFEEPTENENLITIDNS